MGADAIVLGEAGTAGLQARHYSFRRYASNAGRSAAVTNPRSMSVPLDETNGGMLGGGFNRAARLKRAS